MSQSPDTTGSQPGNGTVVLLSVVAAGAAAVAGAALAGRPGKQEQAQSKIDRRVAQLQAGVDKTSTKLSSALSGLDFDRDATTRKARKQSARMQKSSAKTVNEAVKIANRWIADLEKQGSKVKAREQAKGLASQGSDQVATLASGLSQQVSTLMEEARKRARESSQSSQDAVKSTSRDMARKASDEVSSAKLAASDRAHDVKTRGQELAAIGSAMLGDAVKKSPELFGKVEKAADEARRHAPDLKESLSELVGTVAELGGTAAARAKEQAPEVAARVKERAPEVVESVTGTVATKATELKEQAKPLVVDANTRVAGLAEQVKEASSHVRPGIESQASTLGDKVSSGTTAIGDQSRQAATAAGRGAKETGALVMWTAAGATIVYTALLDDKQRQRLKDSGQRVWSEMREVLADMRGYDEEFA
jgi:hypothetical protein